MDEERIRELAAELGMDEDDLRELMAEMAEMASKSDYDLYREWSAQWAARLGDPLLVPEWERALEHVSEAAQDLHVAAERVADALQDEDEDRTSLRAEVERRWAEFQAALARAEQILGGRAEPKP